MRIRLFAQLLCLSLLACLFSACDTIQDVNGSFEESMDSGRLNSVMMDGANRRYFRFHLRQFENDIGGVFESFDLSSYSAFNQVPVLMTNATNFYYCARIDYGYVRDNNVYVSFTDREQRQWSFTAPLGEIVLAGQLNRTQYYGNNVVSDNLDYLLPEDASFKKNNPQESAQIVLNKLEKKSNKPLSCIYYYRKLEVDVVLPNHLELNNCKPSIKQCRSLKLALVGSPALHRIDMAEQVMQTVQTAYLDDCDISGSLRHLILRDNPYVLSSSSKRELFIATLIVYEDLDLDGSWDSSSEPVMAALDGQTFVFYSEIPYAIYGKKADGFSREIPVLNPDELDEKGGWFLFHDESDKTDTAWRMVGTLTPEKSDRLYLNPLNVNPELINAQRGCYVNPVSDDQAPCENILPVLIY